MSCLRMCASPTSTACLKRPIARKMSATRSSTAASPPSPTSAPASSLNRQKVSAPRGFFLFEGVIGRADERPCFDVLEPHLFAELLEFGELVRMDVALDRQMLRSRLHILAEREDVRALRGDFFHSLQNFVAR